MESVFNYNSFKEINHLKDEKHVINSTNGVMTIPKILVRKQRRIYVLQSGQDLTSRA